MSHVIEVNHKQGATKAWPLIVARAPNGRIVNAASVENRKNFRALAAALARKLEGEVRFDDGGRALYATDASNYRQVPIGIVIPRERVLLPKVRGAGDDTVILANGFSCREQIEQGSDRKAKHIAELIADHLEKA